MTRYNKDEVFLIGLDFDGTITPSPLGGFEYKPPLKEFVEFYKWGISQKDVAFVIHTARDLSKDENYQYIMSYLEKYSLNKIYFPKRDGKTLKNLDKEILEFPYKVGINSKLPCSLFIDDINAGVPKLDNGDLDWHIIKTYVEEELEKLIKVWS